jgi:hypothetical protein
LLALSLTTVTSLGFMLSCFNMKPAAATIVTLYLSTSVNGRLEPKLRRELRPGTRVVSHQFGIGNWAPIETVRAQDGTNLFLWTIPAQ